MKFITDNFKCPYCSNIEDVDIETEDFEVDDECKKTISCHNCGKTIVVYIKLIDLVCDLKIMKYNGE